MSEAMAFRDADVEQPMQELPEARLVAGVGIDGDRYATGKGHYSKLPRADRQVTLIEIETLEAIRRDHRIPIEPQETRRNLTARGVPLNHLVGRRFRVGEAVLHGERPVQVPGRPAWARAVRPAHQPVGTELHDRHGRRHPPR
jgi:MOSC domain-containing protein YiiM